MSQASTSTVGCQGNFGSTAQETRALDAPNLQLGELLLDEPLLVGACPAGSRSVVLQAGPAAPGGAAPGCSADVVCVLYARQ
ncbi:MAG: hypothetical protein INH37_21730 [Myxococcaceae bacterium]|nr:hypothetical protein [Myxococcaceae bacterium]